jgi:hypothetical protein
MPSGEKLEELLPHLSLLLKPAALQKYLLYVASADRTKTFFECCEGNTAEQVHAHALYQLVPVVIVLVLFHDSGSALSILVFGV